MILKGTHDSIRAFEWWVRLDMRAAAAEERDSSDFSDESGRMSAWRQECHDTLRRHIRDELLKAEARIQGAEV